MRAATVCAVLAASAHPAAAGRSFYAWLPATEIVPERGTEVETWIAEENDEGDTHLRETLVGAAPVFAASEQLELAVPLEVVRATEDGFDPVFTLRAFGIEGRYRFANAGAQVVPFLRFGLERDVTIRNLGRLKLDPVLAFGRGNLHVVGDAGVIFEANPGGVHFEVHPGAGASYLVSPELRVGGELHAELSLDSAGRSWAAVGPNLAWLRGRSWLVAALGVGVYNVGMAPRIMWGLTL